MPVVDAAQHTLEAGPARFGGAGMGVVAVLWTSFFLINFNIAMMIPLLPFIQAALQHQAERNERVAA